MPSLPRHPRLHGLPMLGRLGWIPPTAMPQQITTETRCHDIPGGATATILSGDQMLCRALQPLSLGEADAVHGEEAMGFTHPHG